MDESRKDKGNLIVEQDNMLPSVIKTDVNLSRLPFFALSRLKLGNFKTELIIVQARGGERLELLWKVTSNPEYGYPSPFARKVHGAVEYLLTRNGFPVPEYFDFSLYEITNVLDLDDSGNILNKVRGALKSIAATTIESKGTYCYLENGQKRFINKLFHLYDTVIFIGESLADGTVADRNRIYFNGWYLKSLNSGYIKPLDFPYWNSLRSDIARRLYEYLSFISFATKCKPFSIEYRKLCEILPVTPQRYLSKAKYCLKTAHQELMATGFLKKVVWRKSKTDPKKRILIYHFGMRAKSELQRGFKDDTYRPVILAVETADIEEIEEVIELEEEEQQAKPKRKQKKAQEEEAPLNAVVQPLSPLNAVVQPLSPLNAVVQPLSPPPIAQELINRGITKTVALDFAESFPDDYLFEKIELHDYKKETGELTTNAAGWLREAIVHDYKPSEQQLQKQAQLERKKAQQEEQRTLEEKAKQLQEARLTEALAQFPASEQWVRERVVEHVKVRETTIKAFGGEPFTEAEIEAMYLRYQAQVPKTDAEKRGWLISHDSKYALSSIISGLNAEQQKSQKEASTEAADERLPLNSIEAVLGEVARQQAVFEAEQKRSDKEK